MSSVAEMPRMQATYNEQIKPALKDELGLSSIMAVPKIEKIVINMGVGEATQNKRSLEDAVYTLETITGQKPVTTLAKAAISNFRLREGVPVGCKVTLRGKKMWEYLDRLVSVALPRVKDFKGVSKKAFDGRGNYTLGLKENIVFLEVDRDKVSQIQGMDITICTTADNNADSKLLLEKLGMPFKK